MKQTFDTGDMNTSHLNKPPLETIVAESILFLQNLDKARNTDSTQVIDTLGKIIKNPENIETLNNIVSNLHTKCANLSDVARVQTFNELVGNFFDLKTQKIKDFYKNNPQIMEDTMTNIIMYHGVYGYDNPELNRRKLENPKPTLEELFMGVYVENLEKQTREAVLILRKKGYDTIESGFGDDRNKGQQMFHFRDVPKINPEDKSIKDFCQRFSIKLTTNIINNGLHIFFNNIGKNKTMEEWTECLNEFANILPDTGNLVVNLHSPDELFETITKYSKEDFLKQTNDPRAIVIINKLYDCKTEEDIENFLKTLEK